MNIGPPVPNRRETLAPAAAAAMGVAYKAERFESSDDLPNFRKN
ncbi:hypothetical protein [Paenibacillus sp. GCM10023250]